MSEVEKAAGNEKDINAATNALILHMAGEAALYSERDSHAAAIQQLDEKIFWARRERARLAKVLEEAGGTVPSWKF